MAAKSKVQPKGKAKAVVKKAHAGKAKPKGLVLTTAQQKAYNKAYAAAATAVRNKIAMRAYSARFRRSRLAAANAMIRKYNAAHSTARAAAIASYASHLSFSQSQQGHQNAALSHRVEASAARHAVIYSRAAYASAGEHAFARRAIARTVDQAQADAHARQVFNRIARLVKKGKKSLKNPKRKPVTAAGKAQSAAMKAAGQAAGLRAAKATPAGPAGGRGKSSKQTAAKAGKPAKATGKGSAKTAKAAASQHAASQAASAKSAKAPAKTAQPRGAPPPRRPGTPRIVSPRWLGDEDTPNCVVIAVANSLLRAWCGLSVPVKDVAELAEACGPTPTIEEALWKAWLTGWPGSSHCRLKAYELVPCEEVPLTGGLIIGYESENGPHAAVSLPGGKMVTWGAVTELTVPVEEAWRVHWEN